MGLTSASTRTSESKASAVILLNMVDLLTANRDWANGFHLWEKFRHALTHHFTTCRNRKAFFFHMPTLIGSNSMQGCKVLNRQKSLGKALAKQTDLNFQNTVSRKIFILACAII